MNEIELVRNNVFTNKIIIIDGQGRSGKNLISILLSTMDKVEKMRLDSQFDYLPRYLQLGKMTKDATITILEYILSVTLLLNITLSASNIEVNKIIAFSPMNIA